MAVGSDDAPGVGGWVSVRRDLGGGERRIKEMENM